MKTSSRRRSERPLSVQSRDLRRNTRERRGCADSGRSGGGEIETPASTLNCHPQSRQRMVGMADKRLRAALQHFYVSSPNVGTTAKPDILMEPLSCGRPASAAIASSARFSNRDGGVHLRRSRRPTTRCPSASTSRPEPVPQVEAALMRGRRREDEFVEGRQGGQP